MHKEKLVQSPAHSDNKRQAMKKEISFYFIRMGLALLLMITLGIAGEWDYKENAQSHPPEISY